jgi:hypothetical protein
MTVLGAFRPMPIRAGMAQSGGYPPLAPGVSTVRYPIPQRTFKYVATVQSVTDERCHFRTHAPQQVEPYSISSSAPPSGGRQGQF